MPGYNINDILDIISGEGIIRFNDYVEHIYIDSRTVSNSGNALFFAISGEHHDGHTYIHQLYNEGIQNFIVEYIPEGDFTKANFIIVNNTIQALQKLAAFHRSNFKKKIIGITGSNGKTIIKEWLFQLCALEYKVIRSPRSFNSQVGVPLSLWELDNMYDLAIIEAGISRPGEMVALEKMIRPEIGIIANIGDAHQKNFDSYDQKTKEKLNLFKNSRIVIYCKDHVKIDQIVKQIPEFKNTLFFTWSVSQKADLQVQIVKKEYNSTLILGKYQGKAYEINLPFTDEASIENAIHAWCTLLYLGFNHENIKKGMLDLRPVEMRLEQKMGINNCTLVNDSYNSDMNALVIALDYLRHQHQHSKKTLILSDIFQAAEDDHHLYKKVAELISKKNIDRFIGIGQRIMAYKHCFDHQAEFYHSTEEFIDHFHKNLFQNEAILLKGARKFEFEKILSLLEYKKHRTVLEINLNAIVHNLNYFRSRCKEKTKILVMVKAFSYGSGLFEIANILQFHRVDYLGVAFIDEGIRLREAGIKTPILVLNPERSQLDQLIKYRLEPEIYSFKMLTQFNELVLRKGLGSYPCHIKIDTGMHRLGFGKEEGDKLCGYLLNMPAIKLQSVFSHLAASDDPTFDDFTNKQIATYIKICDLIENKTGIKFLKHILNTAGIERFKQAQFDMVRLGIGLYGFSPVHGNELMNVTTLKSTLSQVKTVYPGETVGYNPNNKIDRISKIGIVPIGYADGLNRKLGNKNGVMLINGKKVPIIGNICMDMCMVDVSEVEADEGDEIIIFGSELTVSNIAKKMDTIPYEIFTGLSERIKRIYYST